MFSFGRGDLLYGTGNDINDYIEVILASDRTFGRFPTRDDLWRMKSERFAAINTVNTAIRGQDYQVNRTTITVTNPDTRITSSTTPTERRIRTYAEALMGHAKYRPSTASGDFSTNARLRGALTKGQSTLTVHSSPRAINAAAKELAIRRSCKFGIEHAVANGSRIHYALDEIGMPAVVNKTTFDKNVKGHQFQKIPICTTELRFLFRNWQRIGATNLVFFYRGFMTVPPPWQDNHYSNCLQGWADYAHHRVEKSAAKATARYDDIIANSPSDFAALEASAEREVALRPYAAFRQLRRQNAAPSQQIAAFHAIPSQHVNIG
jgi:hypothetical protein